MRLDRATICHDRAVRLAQAMREPQRRCLVQRVLQQIFRFMNEPFRSLRVDRGSPSEATSVQYANELWKLARPLG